MLRVWCEHLDYGEAGRSSVLDLLDRGSLHPLFAVRPRDDRGELAALLEAVEARGLEPGIWPLLSERDGYWPSVANAGRFVAHVEELLADLRSRGCKPAWLAFDLEPPFQPDDTFGASVRRAIRRGIVGGGGTAAFEAAVRTYRAALESLSNRGIGTIGVTTPTAVPDLEGEVPVWQEALQTPWSPLPWDAAGFMAYGSIIAGHSAGLLSYEDARAIHYDFLRQARRHFGGRTHVSLGVTGTGIYGDEPIYERPRELARDVATARAAGIEDIAIFCLEGLLGKAEPQQWVDAIVGASPRVPPPTIRAESVLLGTRLATWLMRSLRRESG